MDDEVNVTVELFDEEKYQKNIQENIFHNDDSEGIGEWNEY